MVAKGKAVLLSFAVLVIAAQLPSHGFASVRIEPRLWANGTIIDEDGDGSPDILDDDFGGSGEEWWGVQLTYDETTHDLDSESRVFFEYKLNSVGFGAPVLARLNFALKGSTRYGVNGDVQLYSYPSEDPWVTLTLADFSREPAVLQGGVSVVAYQPATGYSLCVSDAVDAALASGAAGLGFRFQIDPTSEAHLNHALVVADDNSPETKPALSIAVLGDTNGDDVVDVADFGEFTFCLKGPGAPASPLCRSLDLDCDGDIDLSDFARFQTGFTGVP